MLMDVILLMAVITILGILAFTINSDQRTDYLDGTHDVNCNSTGTEGCSNLYGYNATLESDTGAFKIFSNLDLLGLAAAFGVVLFIILRVIPRTSGGGF